MFKHIAKSPSDGNEKRTEHSGHKRRINTRRKVEGCGAVRNIASIAKVGGRADISESPAARYEQGFGAKQPYSTRGQGLTWARERSYLSVVGSRAG